MCRRVEGLDTDRFPIDQIGQALLGLLAEVLFLFGRIDLLQSDFGLLIAGIENRQSIVIGDTDYATGNVGCYGGW